MKRNKLSLTRRQALAGSSLVLAAPAFAKKKKPKVDPKIDLGPLDDIADRLMLHLRETATYNGVPAALNGGPLAHALDDYSPAGEEALRKTYAEAQSLLARIRIAGDSPAAQHLGSVNAILENAMRSVAIPYGRINPLTFTGHTPYIVSQIAGPHIDGLNIMMEQQALNTPKAVDAWLEKLDDFPNRFAGVIEKMRADKAAGSVPPAALLAKTLPVLDEFVRVAAADHPMIKALTRKTDDARLAKKLRLAATKRAMLILEKRAKPAFSLLREEVAAQAAAGHGDAGIWSQPQGDAFYAANIRALGDTLLNPDEIHQAGSSEIARIASEMNALLAKQGLTKGGIGERMVALATDPKNQFADSAQGREELLTYVRQKVREAEARYSELLPKSLIPAQALVVKSVPLATQESAPGGFYDGPSLDGTRPGTYWINLRDMAAVPRFRLPTLSYHEGVPGHHTQGAIAAALGEAPLLVRMASFNAYQEGWALYAERLMAELGFYKDDPLGNLGRLQDELFRATRLVIDTGLHHKRWTREQAIRTMRDVTGTAESRVTAEVERYMAWPGQALGYKLGQLRLLNLREKFVARHSKATDLRAFHGTILDGGAMPLDLVEARLSRT